MEIKEIRLEITGGIIAGQEWKPEKPVRKVLLLHGWQDNSNSYKNLIPLLPKDWWMVAIDIPGHGYSSARPAGAAYHSTDWVFDVFQVVQKLEWKQFTIIGHSMGAGVGLIYASLFPDSVEAMVSLDVVKQRSDPGVNVAGRTRQAVLALMSSQKLANEIFPTETEAQNWWFERNKSLMTKESADIILQRGLKKLEQGSYEIRRDIRLTFPPVFIMSLEQHRVIMKELKCDLLIIKALGAQDWESAEIENEFLAMYAQNAKRFLHMKVDGLHHVHLNNASAVAPIIVDFLRENELSDRQL